MSVNMKKWYENINIFQSVAYFLTHKELYSLMCVSKTTRKNAETDFIWWKMYHQSFKNIKNIDPYLIEYTKEKAYIIAIRNFIAAKQLNSQLQSASQIKFNIALYGM